MTPHSAVTGFAVAAAVAVFAVPHAEFDGLGSEPFEETSLSTMILELPVSGVTDECTDYCILCVDDTQHNVVDRPEGVSTGLHMGCPDDHDCDDCQHQCGGFACLALRNQVELAVDLLADASWDEIGLFLRNNREAIFVNLSRSALQFRGCREGSVLAHVPVDDPSILALQAALAPGFVNETPGVQ